MNKTFMECNGYAFSGHLGGGMFGKVVKAFSTLKRTSVAIKIVDTKKVHCDYREKFLPHERKILLSLNHPNIVKTYRIFQSPTGTVYIVMELCSKGNLSDHISVNGALAEHTSRTLFKQLCMAVQYLHDKNVAHRDLKCENLLLDEHFNLKVCDFGLSKTLTYTGGQMVLSKTYCGTSTYAAPEILRNTPYNPKESDVWSMGVVLYMMLFGSMPFIATNVKKMVTVQMRHNIKFPDTPSVSAEAKELIRGLLHPDGKQRLTISSILQSRWVSQEEKKEDSVDDSTSNADFGQRKPPEKAIQEDEAIPNIDADAGEGPSTAGM